MENTTMPTNQSFQGAEWENPSQNQFSNGQSQKIGDMEQQIDFNGAKQGYGKTTLKPLTVANNNRNEMPEFGADEKVLNKGGGDEPDGPNNPEIPSEGDTTPVENPITI